jgi:putative SOS response-associated peptidase YedK
MCGRYYLNSNAVNEIESLIWKINKRTGSNLPASLTLQTGDICPTQLAPILLASREGNDLCCHMQRWGFVTQQGKIVFNARSETAAKKLMFSESLVCKRVVIPAVWFYEWNQNREKNIFYQKGKSLLFMAGLYYCAPDGERFVILTTRANESMSAVHDRMPLLLEESEVFSWILKPEQTQTFLKKKPCLLERHSEYEQLSLF